MSGNVRAWRAFRELKEATVLELRAGGPADAAELADRLFGGHTDNTHQVVRFLLHALKDDERAEKCDQRRWRARAR